MLNEAIYIYQNQNNSLSEILKRHPFSIVVYISLPFFSNKREDIIKFLNDFKESSFDFKKSENIFKYKKFFKTIIIRHPIKDTENLKKIKIIKSTLRDTHKVIDQILDFNRSGNKTYIDDSVNLKQLFLIEESVANAEYHKKSYEKKANEIYDPHNDIKYATQKDIDKVRFELGDALFRDKIKYAKPLFPGKGLHYDNDYLYNTYVQPYERKKGKDKK